MDANTIAAVLGGTATLITALGGLRWQDRRPHDSDQARAYRSTRKAAETAAKRRAQYDAAVAELDRARAVAEALDTEPEEQGDEPAVAVDPALEQQRRIAAQMAADATRMEQSVAVFAELVKRSGARLARATITGEQPAVTAPAPTQPAARVQRPPVPGRGVPAAPPSASPWDEHQQEPEPAADPATGPLPTFEELVSGRPGLDYRPPRERNRGPQHPPPG